MPDKRCRQLAGVILALLVLQLAAVLNLPQRVESQAAAETVATPMVAVTTTTVAPPVTVPPAPVFTDGVFANPFPAGVRPGVADVQSLFTAPMVTSPQDLVRFQPAYDLIRQLAVAKWGDSEWLALELLLMHESRFDPRAVQPDTGACGLFQALECGKMTRVDWRGQIEWGMAYIETNYGLPSQAWSFWLSKAHTCAPPNPHGFSACGGWY